MQYDIAYDARWSRVPKGYQRRRLGDVAVKLQYHLVNVHLELSVTPSFVLFILGECVHEPFSTKSAFCNARRWHI